ncbi:uncharacterized protein LOC143598157 isoform X2 [Bidens hawaiensis]|uniref:uncharacterized protein LOC143590439 isoform X2 n=1 Tax=Bidens hawaiensis TaxID=980011 RepID=UPI00404A6284
MGALSSSASPLILRCLLRRPPPSTTTSALHFFKPFTNTTSISNFTPPLPISHTPLSSLIPRPLSTSTNTAVEPVIFTGDETHSDTKTDVVSETQIDDVGPTETEAEQAPVDPRILSAHNEMLSKLKSMSVKEKKELGSYANSLGKKLKSQQVGKSGVTDAVAIALVETLEANELLKLKIHNNCPGELDDVVSQLEEATGSVVVGRIGRTIIIYRPSLTKLKAEEKKKQAMKVFLKRRAAYKASYQSRGQSATSSNRSREYRRS